MARTPSQICSTFPGPSPGTKCISTHAFLEDKPGKNISKRNISNKPQCNLNLSQSTPLANLALRDVDAAQETHATKTAVALTTNLLNRAVAMPVDSTRFSCFV